MIAHTLILLLAGAGCVESVITPVTISHQGPNYWALPLYLADTKGYFTELGITPTFVVYPSGGPQVKAAVDEEAWDIGAAGVVPNIIGGSQAIYTIGISNDESATNALVGTAAGVAAYPPTDLSSTPIALTANSTGQYVVEACLAKEGFDLSTVNFTYGQQSDVVASLEGADVDLGGLWAPSVYTFVDDNEGSDVICSGKDANATVPGGIMVRQDFAESSGGALAMVLAAWMKAIVFIQDPANRDEVLEAMETFYGTFNVTLSPAAMEKEIDGRPLFNLDEQLELMKREGDSPSTVDTWYIEAAAFMEDAGVLSGVAAPNEYIKDEFLQQVKDDPVLGGFAQGGELEGAVIQGVVTEEDHEDTEDENKEEHEDEHGHEEEHEDDEAEVASALTSVTISHQGPNYWALPIYLAEMKGYFTDLDIEPSFVVYPSGAPQVKAAVEEKAWDIGAAGVVPNIIGGSQGIYTIGISNDESATNALVATAAGVDAYPPSDLSSTPIAITPNSTAQYVVEACLAKEGLDLSTVNFTYGQQSDVVASLESGDVDFGGLWAPSVYTFVDDNEGSDVVCSGKDADATVPGGIMVRQDFAESSGDVVAKVLAAWMKAIVFIQDPANRDEVLETMKTFYGTFDVTLSDVAMEKEIDGRPLFNLDEQLELMKRDGDSPSTVDTWYSEAATFMEDAGVLSDVAAPSDYIMGDFMQQVKDDANLSSFAAGGDFDGIAASAREASAGTANAMARLALFLTGSLIVCSSLL